MRIMFVHTEQYTAWDDELFYNLVRGPMIDCGLQLEVQDFVRNHREKERDLMAEGSRLYEQVKNFAPALLIYSHSWYDVPNEWLAKIRLLGVKILTIMWDTLIQTPASEINIARHSDYLAVCDSVSNYMRYRLLFDNFREPGTGVIFISGFHVLPQIFHQKPRDKIYDVTLLGSAEGYRLEVLKYLQNALADTNIKFHKLGGLVNSEKGSHTEGLTDGWLPLENYVDIINQSKILITTQTRPERIQVKGKIFEFMSCGGFCLVDHNNEYEQIIPKEYITYYDSLTDLVEKIKYYVTHDDEREAIAATGYTWYKNNFNYKKFWTDFLNHIADPTLPLPGIPTLESSYQKVKEAHSHHVASDVMTSINTVLNEIFVPQKTIIAIPVTPIETLATTQEAEKFLKRVKRYLKRKGAALKELI
jgi:hypothetical protein